MRKIILASGSPRRMELLEMMGLKFTVMPSQFTEWLDDAQSPDDVSITLGLGKARDVARRFPEAIVIGSDTIVTVDGKQLGKATTDVEAREMLKLCASKPNRVTSSVVVVCKADNYEFAGADNVMVYFKPYDECAVSRYITTGDYKDKAGAWGIQSGAGTLIDHYEGDLETIIGLPTRLLLEPLAHFGITARTADYKITESS